jgi:hypothetical protein
MKRLSLSAALLALSLLASPALADPNPGNDSDALTIRITPAADLGVMVDTANVTLDFTMDMGATAYTLLPATVTIVGNITPQELDLQGANSSVDPGWALDADETAAIDELQLYALFSVDRSSRPAEGDFAGAKNLITGALKRAGTANGAAADQNFENNSMSGGADMDSLPLGGQRQLWLRLDAPPYTSTTSEQSFTVTVTATRSGM